KSKTDGDTSAVKGDGEQSGSKVVAANQEGLGGSRDKGSGQGGTGTRKDVGSGELSGPGADKDRGGTQTQDAQEISRGNDPNATEIAQTAKPLPTQINDSGQHNLIPPSAGLLPAPARQTINGDDPNGSRTGSLAHGTTKGKGAGSEGQHKAAEGISGSGP